MSFKMKGVNHISTIIVILLVTSTYFSSSLVLGGFTGIIQPDPKVGDSSEDTTFFKLNSSVHLRILNVSGGWGVNVKLLNDGDCEVSDVIVDIEVSGGLFVYLPKKTYEISHLQINESTTFTIPIFGVGFGFVHDVPEMTILVRMLDTDIAKKRVVLNVFGFLVKKIGEFLNEEQAYEGYTLFAPMKSTVTYLINNSGSVIHTWKSNYRPGETAYLLEDGRLLRTEFFGANPTFWGGGTGGRVEILDVNGNIEWEFDYSTNLVCQHHDGIMLPNGNVLLIAWEYKSKNEAIAAGRNPDTLPLGELWVDHIIEVQPTGTSGGDIVWEWHIWDHLIQDFDPTKDNYGMVADHPELIDINAVGYLLADWNHVNSIDYNEEFDQILLSSRGQKEIWVIDHSTTTAEAAGHSGGNSGKGGDLLYRWGNPQVYDADGPEDQMFFDQHDASWIEPGYPGEGNILVFNNGFMRPGNDYSSIDEIVPPVDSNGSYYLEPGCAFGPEEPIWIYTAGSPTDFYALLMSGAQRLPNGNTLICDGPAGVFFEVTPDKEIVWRYINIYPDAFQNNVFKIRRYGANYSGLYNILQNNAPLKPSVPEGMLEGDVGVIYNYSSNTSDPDGDPLYYLFDWGDNSINDWLGPYESGERVVASHSWNERGWYGIRVKARDDMGRESVWSDPLQVKMPVDLDETFYSKLIRFFQRFV